MADWVVIEPFDISPLRRAPAHKVTLMGARNCALSDRRDMILSSIISKLRGTAASAKSEASGRRDFAATSPGGLVSALA